MALTVKIDISGVEEAFRKAPEVFERELEKGMKKGLTIIQRHARRHHRFTTRSGDLERSVQTETNRVLDEGKVFLDRGIAIYGRRIHDGFGTWRADKFLFRAAKVRENDVINEINKAVGQAVLKSGF